MNRAAKLFPGGGAELKAMRRVSWFVLVATFSLLLAHRLPAPISEISPTPTRIATAKPKSRPADKPETETKPKSPNAPFAGTWNGTLMSSYQNDDGKTITTPTGCWLTISNDGKIINGNGDIGWGEVRSAVTRNGMTLTWNGQPRNPSVPLSATSTCQLQLSSATSATFTGTRVIINGFLKGTTYKCVGTLRKE